MTEFPSAQEMLEQFIFQKVEENREPLSDDDHDLKMTTTWIVDEGMEIIFGYEKLRIPFQNIQIIVNSSFFKPWSRLNDYPDAYHQLSKNARWESIDTIVRRGETIEINPLSFISLVSCFKGRSSNRRPNLTEVLGHLTYPSTQKLLLVVLSSEDDAERKITEIKDARTFIELKFSNATIEEFKISDEGGGYHGFSASI